VELEEAGKVYYYYHISCSGFLLPGGMIRSRLLCSRRKVQLAAGTSKRSRGAEEQRNGGYLGLMCTRDARISLSRLSCRCDPPLPLLLPLSIHNKPRKKYPFKR